MKTAFVKSLVIVSLFLIASAGPARADFRFGKPQSLGPVINTPSYELGATASMDGLELYFSSQRPGGYGDWDIWVSTRQSVNDPWGPPSNLGPTVNSPYKEAFTRLSWDGLTLYFSGIDSMHRPGGLGGADIWMSTRASRADPWGAPVNMGAPINSPANDRSPFLSRNGLTFVFNSDRAGGYGDGDLWMSTRPTVQDPWGAPVNLGPNVNSPYSDFYPALSADGLALFFCSTRASGYGGYDVWMTTRKSAIAPWGSAVNLGPVINSSGIDAPGGLSADLTTLYLTSDRPGTFGTWDVWEAPILPIVDFSGDGTVNIADLLRLIESWGQEDPTIDVGPMPWGDGVVDAADLEVLMSYWGQEIPNPALIAHWKLDETEGTVAADSLGDNDGIVTGVPLWRPKGGQVDGALELDGASFVATKSVLSPSDGPFSIFAWVKGGTPGQVVISQQEGVNWLMADPATGALMTELQSGGRNSKALHSDAIITDGAWHCVGFTWDGSKRTLYVDGIAVAQDTQSDLAGSTGGLNIGAGSTLAPGTFWSGLIDDVWIYKCVVKP